MRDFSYYKRRGASPPPLHLVWVVVAVVLSAGACSQALGTAGGNQQGTLAIGVGEISASSVNGETELAATQYLFSGTGPNGETFSVVTGDEVTTVEALVTGEWLIEVEGLTDDERVVLTGEAVVEVRAFEDTTLSISLKPVEGVGDIYVSAQWNAEHTLEPSATVVVTAPSGETSTYTLNGAEDGRAERRLSDLATGNYRVSVQLNDGETRVGGSAYTARVINGATVEIAAEFPNINKVGEPIELDQESFAIGWDEPEDSTPDLYRVYYRVYGAYEWELLSEIAAESSPSLTIDSELLAYGTYEFAVSSVTNGHESDLHSSMCDEAQPGSGWFVQWEGP